MAAPIRAGFDRAGVPMSASAFCVRRAVAVAGQVVRVVFSDEPRHSSNAGIDDARNAANYAVTVTQGTGQPVRSIGTRDQLLQFPAYGLSEAGEWAVDLQVDRPLVVGLGYQINVSRAVMSADGQPIGVPYAASFIGAVRPALAPQLRRKIGLVDLASDPFRPGIVVDAAGDWASHEGLEGTKKRIWRIATTAKGGFAFLPNFGLGFDIKKPATLATVGTLRTDLKQQIAQQPDVTASESGATMDSRGFLTITVKAKTADGQNLETTATATPGGITTS